ncbi:hypothetical protein [Pseudonocardia sp. T1-2H]|uniref:hypothetical protein n=1 Tax=Pseudonocardia sp. T1-2H TaxID=3128899 RepID=UPI003101884C
MGRTINPPAVFPGNGKSLRILTADPNREPPCDFPLPNPRPEEVEMWVSLWKSAPAELWLERDIVREVADYCRACVLVAEKPAAAMYTVVRQQRADLALSIPGAQANGVTYAGAADKGDDWNAYLDSL